jgi:hypothetical protein
MNEKNTRTWKTHECNVMSTPAQQNSVCTKVCLDSLQKKDYEEVPLDVRFHIKFNANDSLENIHVGYNHINQTNTIEKIPKNSDLRVSKWKSKMPLSSSATPNQSPPR